MNSPLVSIITPAYNAEKYIKTAIDSIINQSYINWELIVIDDASRDNTWKIVQKYYKTDARIKILRNRTNLNVSRCLNLAISYSRGKYIARMDADDWSFPNRIKEQVTFMENDSNIVASGGAMMVCDVNLKKLYDRKYPESDIQIRKSIFRTSPFCQPSMIYRTKSLIEIGGFTDKEFNEDLDLILRLGQKGKFRNITNLAIKHRLLHNSLTSQNIRMMEIDTLKLRYLAVIKYQYRFNLNDIGFNFIELISILIVPNWLKKFIFNQYYIIKNRLINN